MAIFEKYYPVIAASGGPMPTAPANGSTITTDTPLLSISAYSPGIPGSGIILPQMVQFQWATDTGFTTSVINVFTAIGATSVTMNAVNKLTAEGTWYLRSRFVDIFGNASAWGQQLIPGTLTFLNYFTITNNHPPSATGMAPAGGQEVSFGTGSISFSWVFTDPSATDNQSAYEILLVDTTTNTTIVDTGQVTSTATLVTQAISATYEDRQLSWQLKLWDSHGVAGAYSAPQYFIISVAPAPTITSPTVNQVLATTIPIFTWTSGIAGSKSAINWRVLVTQAGNVIYDTGVQSGAVTSFAVPGGVLQNNSLYTVSISVIDSVGLIGTAVDAFSVVLTPPASPSPVYGWTYDYDTLGFVWVGWDNSDIDSEFVYWNVYRKAFGDSAWTLLGSVTKKLPAYGVADYTMNANTTYQYVVTQVVNRGGGGNLIESAFTGIVTLSITGNYYWLIDTEALVPAIPLFSATQDSLTDEYETNTYTVIGRGRHVDRGEHLGQNGTLVCELTDKGLGFNAFQNYLWDPSFQDSMPYSPEWVFASSSSVNYSTLSFYEPPPSGHQLALKIDAAASSNVTFAQTLGSLPFVNPGDTFDISLYIGNIVPANSFTAQAIIVYKNSSGTTLATHTLSMTSVENWKGNGHWARYAVAETVPTGAIATVNIQYKLTDTSAAGLSVLVTGGQVCQTRQTYIDGDLNGISWQGIPFKSSSATNGFYSARQQRIDVEALKALDHPLFLRTPFGDTYQVSLEDIQFERTAGTGAQSEYGTLTIPYLEVAL